MNLAVEIPAGSFTKYEIKEDGLVHVDRFQSMPVAYPANYGSMPRTLAGDNDPLDALVLTANRCIRRDRAFPADRLPEDDRWRRARREDHRVPTDKVDPTTPVSGTWRTCRRPNGSGSKRSSASQGPAGRAQPGAAKWLGHAAEARSVIREAMQRFKR